MKTSTTVWAIGALVVIFGGWYLLTSKSYPPYSPGSANQIQVPVGTTTQATSTTSISVLNINSNAALGQYLVASNGMTLYYSSADVAGVSKCVGVCARKWPAYTVIPGTPLSVGAGISGVVGTITTADGHTQVTYNGMPLYFWQGDTRPGDTTGNGVKTFLVARP